MPASALDKVRRAAKAAGLQHLAAVGPHSYLYTTKRLLDASPLAMVVTLIPARQVGQVTMQFTVKGESIWTARDEPGAILDHARKALVHYEVLDFRKAIA